MRNNIRKFSRGCRKANVALMSLATRAFFSRQQQISVESTLRCILVIKAKYWAVESSSFFLIRRKVLLRKGRITRVCVFAPHCPRTEWIKGGGCFVVGCSQKKTGQAQTCMKMKPILLVSWFVCFRNKRRGTSWNRRSSQHRAARQISVCYA